MARKLGEGLSAGWTDYLGTAKLLFVWGSGLLTLQSIRGKDGVILTLSGTERRSAYAEEAKKHVISVGSLWLLNFPS